MLFLSPVLTKLHGFDIINLIFKLCDTQVLFDHMGCLKRYDSVQDILKEFFELRLHYYKLRKDWLVGSLGAEASKLSNQARFVLEKIEGKITIGKNSYHGDPQAKGLVKQIFFPDIFIFLREQRTNLSVN